MLAQELSRSMQSAVADPRAVLSKLEPEMQAALTANPAMLSALTTAVGGPLCSNAVHIVNFHANAGIPAGEATEPDELGHGAGEYPW